MNYQAGPPEARCIICGLPEGFNNENHPNRKHTLCMKAAIFEYRVGLFMGKFKGWFNA
ncbi:hypothetical protein SEQ_HALENA_23 [Mycobacterium phage Halena]|uniref:Uncharacterized protein n=10 Tax=Bronvirus TaxID=1623278 RepID=E0YPF6_9CAUD|nr:hypothetical protein LEBRON_23 [Mycobacterium phage LeBron]YP_009635868.1 hypothetical protein FGG55_gp023 [Mycobacterium phage JoeDirt]YP_010100919.1 hypothetical protein KNU44_gp023 [Mycobacterium phage CicholasNage]YP_010101329.1 hypothetical protein KNU48_gp023 [Mycobacterium phage Silverleaf]YP_010105425.1 hypothetical protein KNU85_gp023 [Mycobacterium phage DirkDirk]YP_010114723.1 hypothetical protein KNV76_gp023 [Mycobacterium phage OhShagHennessy]AEK07567.1 hypothetical protein UP